MRLRILATWVLISGFAVSAGAATPATSAIANRLFERLAGVPLPLTDSRRTALETAVAQGQWDTAAHMATDDDGFYNITLVHWATPVSDRNESAYASLSDATAMIVGTVRDDNDFREILSGNYKYSYAGPDQTGAVPIPAVNPGDNSHYETMESNNVNLRQELARVEPQRADIADAAGVLTSRAWAQSHYIMGTNRRALDYAFREFLCSSVGGNADGSIPDYHIRRDVDRHPGGATETFLNTCRTCHAGMDALSGAFAYVDFVQLATGGELQQTTSKVQHKYNQNGNVFPAGFITTDDSWTNLWTGPKHAQMGWRGPTQGHGIRELGMMLAQSRAFSRCTAQRVFTQVCFRPPTDAEVEPLADTFENSGYRLRRLFEVAATLPQCLGR